jgi:hypothetical protein
MAARFASLSVTATATSSTIASISHNRQKTDTTSGYLFYHPSTHPKQLLIVCLMRATAHAKSCLLYCAPTPPCHRHRTASHVAHTDSPGPPTHQKCRHRRHIVVIVNFHANNARDIPPKNFSGFETVTLFVGYLGSAADRTSDRIVDRPTKPSSTIHEQASLPSCGGVAVSKFSVLYNVPASFPYLLQRILPTTLSRFRRLVVDGRNLPPRYQIRFIPELSL